MKYFKLKTIVPVYFVAVVFLSLFLSSCQKDDSPIITQTFELDTFTGIDLSLAGDVTIVEGLVQMVEVTGPEETVNKINKVASSGLWDIKLPNDYNKSYRQLDIKITSSNLNQLILSGSGEIEVESIFPVADLLISGSGSINVKTDTPSLNAIISGSGSITVSGYADVLFQKILGSGSFKGFALETIDAEVIISGSGSSEVFVTDFLDVNISGSGSVYYIGAPVINSNISGSGRIVNRN
jgi:hypothetical protein